MGKFKRYVFLVAILTVCATARAIDFGWQPLTDGGIEYMVQVEPDLRDVFRRDGFTRAIPLGLRHGRRSRIVVGEGRLPNQGDINGPQPASPTAAGPSPAASEAASAPKTPVQSDVMRSAAGVPQSHDKIGSADAAGNTSSQA